MPKRTTPMTPNQEIASLKKMVESLERTNRMEMAITNRMLRAVLLKAVKGTFLVAVMNNKLKPVSTLSVADQYLEMK